MHSNEWENYWYEEKVTKFSNKNILKDMKWSEVEPIIDFLSDFSYERMLCIWRQTTDMFVLHIDREIYLKQTLFSNNLIIY